LKLNKTAAQEELEDFEEWAFDLL